MTEPAETGQAYYISKTSERSEQGYVIISKTSERGERGLICINKTGERGEPRLKRRMRDQATSRRVLFFSSAVN